jgi:Family of unknown function (DUF6308)
MGSGQGCIKKCCDKTSNMKLHVYAETKDGAAHVLRLIENQSPFRFQKPNGTQSGTYKNLLSDQSSSVKQRHDSVPWTLRCTGCYAYIAVSSEYGYEKLGRNMVKRSRGSLKQSELASAFGGKPESISEEDRKYFDGECWTGEPCRDHLRATSGRLEEGNEAPVIPLELEVEDDDVFSDSDDDLFAGKKLTLSRDKANPPFSPLPDRCAGETVLDLGRNEFAKVSVSLQEALQLVLGFCFSKVLKEIDGVELVVFEDGYRCYDCYTDGDPNLTVHDVFVANGLNARMNISNFNASLARLSASVPPNLNLEVDFWLLPEMAITHDVGEGQPGHLLWAADKFFRTKGIQGAKSSKTWHHKFPTKMPLHDSNIRYCYGEESWIGIWRDLQRHADAFTCLEEAFAAIIVKLGYGWAKPLKRLRLLDIIVWTLVQDREPKSKDIKQKYLSAGKEILTSIETS